MLSRCAHADAARRRSAHTALGAWRADYLPLGSLLRKAATSKGKEGRGLSGVVVDPLRPMAVRVEAVSHDVPQHGRRDEPLRLVVPIEKTSVRTQQRCE